jgi:hypothetical protein
VTDFGNGGDLLDLRGWNAITDFKGLQARHPTVSGHGVIIHAGSDELVLQHTTKAELHASDFLF